MALKGEAKKLYQRGYMRSYMRKKRGLLRPIVKTQAAMDADGQPIPDYD